MSSTLRLTDLSTMHPRLLWNEIIAAAAAVLGEGNQSAPHPFQLDLEDLPGFGSGRLDWSLDTTGVSDAHVERLRRTFESSRLVELAAIAIAGLGLYHGGGHEIMDVALRGTAADYLVDSSNYPLEIGGRSRRSDLKSAWQQKWAQLAERRSSGFYLCIVEFETRTGRLAFAV